MNFSRVGKIVKRAFCLSGGANFSLEVVRKTTTYWGWHRSTKPCDNAIFKTHPKGLASADIV
jgi:hypothetical protein